MNATAQVVKNGGNKDDMKRSQARKRKMERAAVIVGFLFVPMLLLIVFTYVPLAEMIEFSFLKWDGISKNREFIGFANYKEVFTRPEYFKVLLTSVYYFVGSVIQIVLALYFATVLNYKIKGKNFFKGVIFFPYLINGVAIGFMFLYFYKEGGTLDTVLMALGVPKEALPLWLGDVKMVNISLVFVSVWRYLGQNMVMFNGAIQSVSGDLLEAAEIDGANRWHQFWYIIFPNIKTIVSLNLILAVKGAISVFEIPYIMTGGSGNSATFVTKTIQTAFSVRKVGLASAMGVVLLVLIMIVTFIQQYFFEGKEEA